MNAMSLAPVQFAMTEFPHLRSSFEGIAAQNEMMPFRHIYQPVVHLLVALFLGLFFRGAQTAVIDSPALTHGAVIHYQLPTDGPLPRTYLVTLAVTDPKDPHWVIGNFASGLVRTVTTKNQGHFTDAWNGLDENYMPVPPGTYGVKGIYLPATKWGIDGQYHAVIPKLAATGASWGQSPSQDSLPDKIEGDPVESPLGDVDVAANGKGSVAFVYLENGRNYFLTDFNKPIGYDQIITGYESGVFAGATSTCTDGEAIWSFSVDGGVKFVGRADGQPFGHQRANRDNVYIPDGWVTALAAWTGPGGTVVFDAERGKIVGTDYHESPTDAIDRVRALDGRDAAVLAQWNIARPLGLAARGNRLYVLHGSGADFEVLSLPLARGWEKARPILLFKVPAGIKPFDIEADGHGRVYLSDSAANHVYQFDARGHLLRTYGRLNSQLAGHYDPLTFMAPEKLACWTDSHGQDRLLVVEQEGPNRLSEWSGDTGKMLRPWVVPQTESNNGYAIDPHHPDLIYMQGPRSTLVRWKIDYSTGQWTIDAVWTTSDFGGKLVQELASPRLIYRGNDAYLAFGRGYAVFHLEGDRLRACAAILADRDENGGVSHYLWRDLNGDGQVQADEYRPYATDPPPGTLRYFGESWFDDLSLVCIGQNSADIWRLACTGFDRRGTPLYDPRGWRKLLSDEIFLGRQAGRGTALRGANEVATNFNSDWASIVKGASGELYVSARSGIDFTANHGAQYKLSRYVPDGKNGYRQSWRVGRMTIEGNADPGQVYGPIYVSPPLNGLIGVIDNARAGVVLYTEDGLYVDTLFPDDHLIPHDQMGAYWQPGEYFAGSVYGNRDNGRIYFALGKTMPQIFEAQGWSLTQYPVHSITVIDQTVSLTAGDIAAPPEAALQMRGGPAAAHVARFYPSPGQAPALDGSLRGWEACDPVRFGNGASQTVEVRCFYDPGHLYLRWHARLGHDVEIKSLGLPQHLFAHDRAADTLGLYLQGDPKALPDAAASNGRPGDVRFVFGLFKQNGAIQPVVLGMYPTWSGAGAAPQTYRTPAGGTVAFARVGLVSDARMGYKLDGDGQGFTLAAALPRAALPGSSALDGWRTQGNFDANFGGHDKFWWSNADGSASRETFDEPSEARFYPGSWSLIQCVPMTDLPIHSWMAIGPFGSPEIDRLDYDKDREKNIQILFGSRFPPDTVRDMTAIYDGPLTHTRAAQRRLSWQKVELSTDAVDFQKALGWSGGNDEGTAYLLTHIYSPRAAEVTLQVSKPGGQYAIHGQLNGKPLPFITESPGPWTHLDSSQPLRLQAGWNELLIRRDFIWGEMTLGATLKADPNLLWQLRVSGPP
jgi:hypothetical protein